MIDLPHAVWRKSRRSTASGENCVELAGLPGAVAVRDSKNPDGTPLAFDHAAMSAFFAEVKAARHDL